MSKQICPICGENSLDRAIKRVSYEYKLHTFYIDQPGEWCSSCGEGILYPDDHKAVQVEIQEQKSLIDGLLTPSAIQKIRESLKLTQKQAGQLFGGGINAFNRYETGVNPVPRPLSLLLILLEKHPKQLAELKNISQQYVESKNDQNHTNDDMFL